MRVSGLLGVLASLTLFACDPQPTDSSSRFDPGLQRSVLADEYDAPIASAIGEGQYDIGGLIVTFSLNAVADQDPQKAEGEFTIYADEGDGLIVDFEGKVTCLSVDPVNHRAWIGGKIKENRSTDPTLLTDIHRKARDIWFRVLDEPGGDRSTFLGFEGSAGFVTSAEYCAGQPWPDANARTWPVVSGGFTVHP